jgi:hypothetical protein
MASAFGYLLSHRDPAPTFGNLAPRPPSSYREQTLLSTMNNGGRNPTETGSASLFGLDDLRSRYDIDLAKTGSASSGDLNAIRE